MKCGVCNREKKLNQFFTSAGVNIPGLEVVEVYVELPKKHVCDECAYEILQTLNTSLYSKIKTSDDSNVVPFPTAKS
jgi:hypothetical protein